MLDRKAAREIGAAAVCSIRDLIIALGASDKEIRDMDERDEILKREPWRRDSVRFVQTGTLPNGWKIGYSEGSINWSGTRFENDDQTVQQ